MGGGGGRTQGQNRVQGPQVFPTHVSAKRIHNQHLQFIIFFALHMTLGDKMEKKDFFPTFFCALKYFFPSKTSSVIFMIMIKYARVEK